VAKDLQDCRLDGVPWDVFRVGAARRRGHQALGTDGDQVVEQERGGRGLVLHLEFPIEAFQLTEGRAPRRPTIAAFGVFALRIALGEFASGFASAST
jgi:hypothetical protein